MSILPITIDYTSRDFESIAARLFNVLQSVYPKWSDRSAANFGNIMLEGMAFVGDVKAFHLDSKAREGFLATATQLQNVLRHARRNAYVPRGPSAATADIRFTFSPAPVNDVLLTTGLLARTKSPQNPLRFQLLADTLVPAATALITVSSENSETKTEIFESDESADFEILLEFTPFLSVVSLTDSTGAWTTTPVDSFLDSTATDKHFRLFRSSEDKGLARFGDNINGKIPVGDVTVVYKVGGGQVAVEASQIEVPEFTLTDIFGNAVQFTVTNPSPSVGGTARETIEEIRINAPASLRTNERSVTQDDFSTNARRVAGVARALILTSDDLASIAENFGELGIVAEGTELASGKFASGTPSQAMLDAVRSKIDNEFPSTITFDYNVSAAVFKSIDVTTRVFIAEGFSAATVDTNIRNAFADFLAVSNADKTPNTAVGFGYEFRDKDGNPDSFLAWSDIFNAVRDTTGVRKVDRATFLPLDDVLLTLNEFPVVGTLTLVDAETGLPLV